MRSKLTLAVIMLLAFMGAITSCKKTQNNPRTVEINQQDNGKTTVVSTAEILALTVGNPGDGGYTFDPLQYDSTVLSLKDHTRNLPKNTNTVGDFGSDTWEFRTLRTGNTALTITATRGSDKSSTIVIFTGNVTVR